MFLTAFQLTSFMISIPWAPRQELKNRVRNSKEGLTELAEDVEKLTRLGYSEADLAMMEVLGIDHFIVALHEEEMRLRLWWSRLKPWEKLYKLLCSWNPFIWQAGNPWTWEKSGNQNGANRAVSCDVTRTNYDVAQNSGHFGAHRNCMGENWNFVKRER